jgi:DMSO/TMAO reductase YedYZ molybdopterin-dependent catalytic subunit
MKIVRQSFWMNSCRGMLAIAFTMISCESGNLPDPEPGDSGQLLDFPSFITPVDSYFRYSISETPVIDKDSFQLKISGAVNTPATFTLEELRNLDLTERTVTIECIGNPAGGTLLGNAKWKGFSLYKLLLSLGINVGASTVKYISADGYYTYNTMAELQNADVLGALYMNDDPIPAIYGFPLRIIYPGYYGVRQPGWIVEIEVLEFMEEDYWQLSGWKTDTSMSIDSKFFLPSNNTKFTLGDSVVIGGAAFGSKRISGVDITIDEGNTWTPATIVQKLDEDYTWVFWELAIVPQSAGTLTIRSRATGQDGSIQPRDDNDYLDGTNSWPLLNIHVEGL